MIGLDSETLEEMSGKNEEVHFPGERILSSTTDMRGVITFANPEFCEISGMAIDELTGAPHKIVRHPDMPRGVFHLMWARLKAGLPVCTYVKNQTKSGGFYWVLALVTPMQGGYVSVRIKPSSAVFETAKRIYKALLDAEANGLTPDRSDSRFIQELSAAGYSDFDDFMRDALNAELSEKDKAMGHECPKEIAVMNELSDLIAEIDNLVGDIGVGFQQIRGEPVNMRILSGRLDGAGAAIGTISQNYDVMADEMQQMIMRMQSAETGALSRMKSATARGRFSAHVSRLLRQTALQEKQLDPSDVSTREFTQNILPNHAKRLAAEAQLAAREIAATGKDISDFCRQLRRRINGLDVVKLLCRVESGRIGNSDSGLQGIIVRLEQFHERTDVFLADLAAKANQITAKSSTL